MNLKYFISEKIINPNELNESRTNNRLNLRKKKCNQILMNKRFLLSEIESIFTNSSSQELPNELSKNNLMKILSNEDILKLINEINSKLFGDNNLTELFQCLYSLDFNMNQNLLETVIFMNENKIYIILVDLLEQIVNSNIMNNKSQLIFKILQILFKYSSNEENNIKLREYNNDKIYIF